VYITLREALDIGVLKEAAVIAGARGLDRVVKSVTVMDTPDIELWLHGGELLLTNAYVLRGDNSQWASVLERVNDRGAAGVGIKVRDFLEGFIPNLVEVCDRLNLPLIRMPVQYAWVDVITPLLGEIINRQTRLLEHALEVHGRLSGAILGGAGLRSVAEELATLTGSGAVILDAAWEVLVCVKGPAPSREVLASVRAALSAAAPSSTSPGVAPPGSKQGPFRAVAIEGPHPGRSWVAAVHLSTGREVYGYIVVPGFDRRPRDFDLVAIEQAAIVAALEILRDKTGKAIERRFRDTFLFDVLSGNIEDPELAIARGKELGWSLGGSHVVAVISLDTPGEWPGTTEVTGSLRRALIAALGPHRGMFWVERTDGLALCIPMADSNRRTASGKPGSGAPSLHRLGDDLKAAAESLDLPCSVTVGLGRVHAGIAGLAASYREAGQAVALGRRLWGGNRVFQIEDLGFYGILVRHPLPAQEVERLCRQTLGPLLDYDERGNGPLLQTLQAYLDHMGSWVKAAKVLNVHPNTLGYRLGRIQELLGVDLSLPEQRFHVQMALRLFRLFEEGRTDAACQ
jgi:purine catabolism regulator